MSMFEIYILPFPWVVYLVRAEANKIDFSRNYSMIQCCTGKSWKGNNVIQWRWWASKSYRLKHVSKWIPWRWFISRLMCELDFRHLFLDLLGDSCCKCLSHNRYIASCFNWSWDPLFLKFLHQNYKPA